jgi:thiol-disulfide isomerase/thioredoxin
MQKPTLRSRLRTGLVLLGALTLAAVWLAPSAAVAPPARPEGTFGRQLRIVDEPVLAPDYVFREAGGREWGFLEFRGKVVVANIWATWCGVCRKELPKLDRLEAALGDAGVTVVALAQDADADAVKATLAKRGLSNLRPFQDVDSVLTASLGVFGVPTTFVIDPQGYIVGVAQGAADWDSPEARAFLTGLVPQAPKTAPTSHNAP